MFCVLLSKAKWLAVYPFRVSRRPALQWTLVFIAKEQRKVGRSLVKCGEFRGFTRASDEFMGMSESRWERKSLRIITVAVAAVRDVPKAQWGRLKKAQKIKMHRTNSTEKHTLISVPPAKPS